MKPEDNYNIIQILLDGLRHDKVDSSSSLRSIKENSIYFSNMITAAPYTLASVHAIFSGMYPSRNGVNGYCKMSRFRKDEITTITQLLKEQNYFTCCDVIHDAIVPSNGFDEKGIFDEDTVDFKKRHSEVIQKLSKKEKFFLFLHYTEPHKHLVDELNKIRTDSEYDKSENIDTDALEDKFFESREENEVRYDSYMHELDNYVNCIINTVKDCGISDKTILIFHSDHGTSLGEKKGEKFYGVFTYDYTIKVFSIIHIPHEKPQLVNSQCRTLDLYPTIGNLANIPKDKFDPMIQGSSLLPLINNQETKERDVFVETGGLYGPWPSPEKHNIFCVRLNGKKLIYNDTPETWEFYDLTKDPSELHNEYDEKSNEISSLKDLLISHLKENQIETKISQ